MEVRIETLDPFTLLTTETTGPYHLSAPEAWTRLFTWLGENQQVKPVQLVGFGRDDPFKTTPELIHYVAGVKYEGTAKDDPARDIKQLHITGGKYAIHTLQGPYLQMPDCFARLKNEWIKNTEHEVDDERPLLEIYLNDPFEVSEEDYLTDIHLPLK